MILIIGEILILDNKNPRLFEKLIFFEALQYNELHGELAYDYLRLSINGINKAYQIHSINFSHKCSSIHINYITIFLKVDIKLI